MTRGQWITLAVALVASALTGLLDLALDASAVLVFVSGAVALSAVAAVISFATEQLGERFSPFVTGLLQSTLGNVPELFIVLFALRAGDVIVAEYSLIGSLLGNALLMLGLVILVGAFRAPDGTMRFQARLPNDTATLLNLAVFAIVIVAVSHAVQDPASHHRVAVSAIASVAMLVVYAVWLLASLRSGDASAAAAGHGGRADEPATPLGLTVAVLAVAGIAAAFVSDWFVSAVGPAADSAGISQEFVALVVVALAGNASENATGVILAWKGQADTAIAVVKASVSQIAVLLWPALVLLSLAFETHLTFGIPYVYVAAIVLTAVAVWQITGDGEATAFEGAALVALYVILGALALYE